MGSALAQIADQRAGAQRVEPVQKELEFVVDNRLHAADFALALLAVGGDCCNVFLRCRGMKCPEKSYGRTLEAQKLQEGRSICCRRELPPSRLLWSQKLSVRGELLTRIDTGLRSAPPAPPYS